MKWVYEFRLSFCMLLFAMVEMAFKKNSILMNMHTQAF
jgi:hypothetical protein